MWLLRSYQTSVWLGVFFDAARAFSSPSSPPVSPPSPPPPPPPPSLVAWSLWFSGSAQKCKCRNDSVRLARRTCFKGRHPHRKSDSDVYSAMNEYTVTELRHTWGDMYSLPSMKWLLYMGFRLRLSLSSQWASTTYSLWILYCLIFIQTEYKYKSLHLRKNRFNYPNIPGLPACLGTYNDGPSGRKWYCVHLSFHNTCFLPHHLSFDFWVSNIRNDASKKRYKLERN